MPYNQISAFLVGDVMDIESHCMVMMSMQNCKAYRNV